MKSLEDLLAELDEEDRDRIRRRAERLIEAEKSRRAVFKKARSAVMAKKLAERPFRKQ